jgi:type II secretory pathway component PulK
VTYSNKTAPSGNRGSVIFIVLVFIIAVSTLVLVSTLRFSSEVDFLDSEMERLHAYTGCVSGMEYLKNRLSTGTTNNTEFLDGMNQPNSPRLFLDGRDILVMSAEIVQRKYSRQNKSLLKQGTGFVLNLQDSAGLINFFKTDRQLLKNLFTAHDIPLDRTEEVLDSLTDWMDSDNFIRPNGAESAYYMKNYGYSAANRIIDSNDQMLRVKGVDNNVFARIGRLLDFNPTNLGVNPNTMSPEAFVLFNGLSDDQIDRIRRKREERPIEGAAELTLISGYNFTLYQTSLQFFTSNTTYVTIKAKMNEKRYFYIQFRLDRVGGGGSMRSSRPAGSPVARQRAAADFNDFYHIYHWQEGTDLQEETYE